MKTINEYSEKMITLISEAPISEGTKKKLIQLSSNPDEIVKYIKSCIKNKPGVGKSVSDAGRVSFEDVLPKLEQILADYKANSAARRDI